MAACARVSNALMDGDVDDTPSLFFFSISLFCFVVVKPRYKAALLL